MQTFEQLREAFKRIKYKDTVNRTPLVYFVMEVRANLEQLGETHLSNFDKSEYRILTICENHTILPGMFPTLVTKIYNKADEIQVEFEIGNRYDLQWLNSVFDEVVAVAAKEKIIKGLGFRVKKKDEWVDGAVTKFVRQVKKIDLNGQLCDEAYHSYIQYWFCAIFSRLNQYLFSGLSSSSKYSKRANDLLKVVENLRTDHRFNQELKNWLQSELSTTLGKSIFGNKVSLDKRVKKIKWLLNLQSLDADLADTELPED